MTLGGGRGTPVVSLYRQTHGQSVFCGRKASRVSDKKLAFSSVDPHFLLPGRPAAIWGSDEGVERKTHLELGSIGVAAGYPSEACHANEL